MHKFNVVLNYMKQKHHLEDSVTTLID